MKKTVNSVAILFALTISGCTNLLIPSVKTELHELRSGNYRIDPGHARVLFKVNHLGLSTYVGRFNNFDAMLDFDQKNLASSILEATIETGSIDLNDQTLEDNLRGSDWFNVAQFSEAVFTTESVQPLNDSQLNFKGNLTLLGITKPVNLLIDFHGGATNILSGKYTIGFSATGEISRSEFGMDKYSGLVGDEVVIEVYAEFQRQ